MKARSVTQYCIVYRGTGFFGGFDPVTALRSRLSLNYLQTFEAGDRKDYGDHVARRLSRIGRNFGGEGIGDPQEKAKVESRFQRHPHLKITQLFRG